MNVTDAVQRRRSTRAFKPDPMPETVVREILDLASRAPSGGNLQPWRVTALAGAPLAELKAQVAAKVAEGIMSEPTEYDCYPHKLWEPFRTRRHETGAQRYAALGVTDKDPDALRDLLKRNFRFFDAPVGLFFALDRRLGPPQWSDVGMYMQTVMLLAVERGLDTCPQESWYSWPKTVGAFIGLPDDHILFAGMSMGYADTAHPLNAIRTTREPLEAFAELRGF